MKFWLTFASSDFSPARNIDLVSLALLRGKVVTSHHERKKRILKQRTKTRIILTVIIEIIAMLSVEFIISCARCRLLEVCTGKGFEEGRALSP